MNYLVDANVLSEATKPAPDEGVIRWLRRHEKQLVLDPIVLGEIQFGIACLPAGKRQKRLQTWFDSQVHRFICLPWDAESGIRWGTLLAHLRRRGHVIPIKDSLIAASALRHGLTVATRNTEDFSKTGVPLVNPFE